LQLFIKIKVSLLSITTC